jgi:hypothetical protein
MRLPCEIIADPNTYFPLIPGTTRIYKGSGETITVTVTNDTKEILGVTCIVIHDVVEKGGEVIEDTFDWYGQDINGNVWYFGESVKDFEDGQLVSLDGSWEAGVDGAKPGIIMKASPQVGDTYRQEFFLGDAEDMGEVLSLNESVTVPYGAYDNVLKTKDWTPIEPDVYEHKFYAPNIGTVMEINPETGDKVELIDIQ